MYKLDGELALGCLVAMDSMSFSTLVGKYRGLPTQSAAVLYLPTSPRALGQSLQTSRRSWHCDPEGSQRYCFLQASTTPRADDEHIVNSVARSGALIEAYGTAPRVLVAMRQAVLYVSNGESWQISHAERRFLNSIAKGVRPAAEYCGKSLRVL